MLPEMLAGSYQRYKNDTDVFLAWLSKTAKACGYKPPKTTAPPASSRPPLTSKSPNVAENAAKPQTLAEKLRSQAEKKAKKREEKKKKNPTPSKQTSGTPTVKHVINTYELLQQAETISNSSDPTTTIPDAIVQALDRAIQARKRCAAWFSETGVNNGQSTEGHVHFIEILEQALKRLKPTYQTKTARSSIPKPSSPSKAPLPRPLHDPTAWRNSFDSLEIEEAKDTAEPSKAPMPRPESPTKKEFVEFLMTAITDMFRDFFNDQLDRTFDVFCFFEDLHQIRGFLADKWTAVREGKIDLVTAAILTNAAFDLIRREERDIMTRLSMTEESDNQKLDYSDLTALVYFANSVKRTGETGSNDQLEVVTPYDDFIFLSTWTSIMRFDFLMRRQKHLSRGRLQYPLNLPPSMTVRYLRTMDKISPAEAKTMNYEDEFVIQYLMDLSLKENTDRIETQPHLQMHWTREVFAQHPHSEPLIGDEFSKGYQTMRTKGEISTWFVFAMRILLDIQDILGKGIDAGAQLLKETACEIISTIDAHLVNGNMVVNGENWRGGPDLDAVKRLEHQCRQVGSSVLKHVKEDILKDFYREGDPFAKGMQPSVEQQRVAAANLEKLGIDGGLASNPAFPQMAQSLGIKPIPANPDMEFIINRNPILCGFRIFQLMLDAEFDGMRLETFHHTIFYAAHLYNATNQAQQRKVQWPDMDAIIKQNMTTLFGSKMPETMQEIEIRFYVQFGVSFADQAASRSGRSPGGLTFRRGMKDGPPFHPDEVAAVFRQYFAKKNTMSQCVYAVETILAGRKSPASQRSQSSQFTPIELVQRLEGHLVDPIEALQINYVSMVRTCSRYLQEFMYTRSEQLGIELLPLDPLPAEALKGNREQRIIIMTRETLQEAARVEMRNEVTKKATSEEQSRGSLAIAGEVFDEFIAELEELKTMEAELASSVVPQTSEVPAHPSQATAPEYFNDPGNKQFWAMFREAAAGFLGAVDR